MHKASNYLDLLSELPKYCCLIEICYFNLIEIRLKFKTAIQDHKQGKVPYNVFPKDTTEWHENVFN